MQIKELFIKRYGPLQDNTYALSPGFNLFFGSNEDGKTLSIDALVKLLLGKDARPAQFERINRVDEDPAGYVILEDEKKHEIKLPEMGNLLNSRLSATEWRNIFIIRDSDLSISQEDQFYVDVTDRLTGLRTKEIKRVEDCLRDAANLTEGGVFRNTAPIKLKTKIDDALALIKDAQTRQQEAAEEKFDMLEQELAWSKDQLKAVEARLDVLGKARNRANFEKGKQVLEELHSALETLAALEMFTKEEMAEWDKCEENLTGTTAERETLLDDLRDTTQKLEAADNDLAQVQKEFDALQTNKKAVDDERGLLDSLAEMQEDLAQQEAKLAVSPGARLISAALLAVSLLGAVFRPSLPFYVLSGIFLMLAAVCWGTSISFARRKGLLSRRFEKLRLSLARYGLDAPALEGMLKNIAEFETKFSTKNKELQQLQLEDKVLVQQVDALQERLDRNEQKTRELERQRDGISKRSGLPSIGEYNAKIAAKGEAEAARNTQTAVLKNLFDSQGTGLEENIRHWKNELQKLEPFRDAAAGTVYNSSEADGLQNERDTWEEKIDVLTKKGEQFRSELAEIERRANEVLTPENDYLHCQTLTDLAGVVTKLNAFVEENENRRKAAQTAIAIFEEIRSEEKEKVSGLFGKDTTVSDKFRCLTGGLYTEVCLSAETEKIEVQNKNLEILAADKLSGGAYDQLYFSIRLALGEKLLGGETGFFVLDDPFIKADFPRLCRQLEMLEEAAAEGWQILYFSAKKEIFEALGKEIKAGGVTYHKVQGLSD